MILRDYIKILQITWIFFTDTDSVNTANMITWLFINFTYHAFLSFLIYLFISFFYLFVVTIANLRF